MAAVPIPAPLNDGLPASVQTEVTVLGAMLLDAVAIVDARKIANLEVALESRDIIGQAKGILMERFKVSASHAFGLLVAVSQHTHRKLNAVAEDLATTGELPDLADERWQNPGQ